MVDFKECEIEIIKFIVESISKFRTEIGEPKSLEINCNPTYGKLEIGFDLENEIKNEDKNTFEFHFKKYNIFESEKWKTEIRKVISEYKYFEEAGILEFSGNSKMESINKFFSKILFYVVRNATKKTILPTTILKFELEELNYIVLNSSTEKFGRIVTKYFRDETYEEFLKENQNIKNVGLEQYIKNINKNISTKDQELIAEKAMFYSSLSEIQKSTLNKIILGILDSNSFKIMVALDENSPKDSGISLKVDNQDVTEIPMIGNGNLSGEYFDWIERFSEYGEFQH